LTIEKLISQFLLRISQFSENISVFAENISVFAENISVFAENISVFAENISVFQCYDILGGLVYALAQNTYHLQKWPTHLYTPDILSF
jgi:hypothetical protein